MKLSFPIIPDRGTSNFRKYAGRVMLDGGEVIRTDINNTEGVYSFDDTGWNWDEYDYYLKSEVTEELELPKGFYDGCSVKLANGRTIPIRLHAWLR